jgi:regulator of sigma E protease
VQYAHSWFELPSLIAAALPAAATLGRLCVFVLMISMLIVLHEYGHFWAARRNGVRVIDFALGIGPTLLKWTSPRTTTSYRINLFPIGGYCVMKDASLQKNISDEKRDTSPPHAANDDDYANKATWQRMAIVLAGPATNIVVAVCLMVVSYAWVGMPVTSAVLGAIEPNHPASRAGLRQGDRIVSANGIELKSKTDSTHGPGDRLVEIVSASIGKPVSIVYERDDRRYETTAYPEAGSSGQGRIGFVKTQTLTRIGFFAAVGASVKNVFQVTSETIASLLRMVTAPKSIGTMHGVVGIASISNTVLSLGFERYVYFTALISVALGIFNLLPIPALDGGRAIFIVAEMVRGKPIDAKKEHYVTIGGFAVLLALMVVISINDIVEILSGKL